MQGASLAAVGRIVGKGAGGGGGGGCGENANQPRKHTVACQESGSSGTATKTWHSCVLALISAGGDEFFLNSVIM